MTPISRTFDISILEPMLSLGSPLYHGSYPERSRHPREMLTLRETLSPSKHHLSKRPSEQTVLLERATGCSCTSTSVVGIVLLVVLLRLPPLPQLPLLLLLVKSTFARIYFALILDLHTLKYIANTDSVLAGFVPLVIFRLDPESFEPVILSRYSRTENNLQRRIDAVRRRNSDPMTSTLREK